MCLLSLIAIRRIAERGLGIEGYSGQIDNVLSSEAGDRSLKVQGLCSWRRPSRINVPFEPANVTDSALPAPSSSVAPLPIIADVALGPKGVVFWPEDDGAGGS